MEDGDYRAADEKEPLMAHLEKPASVTQLEIPGPQIKQLLARDHDVVSRAYHREHPLAPAYGRGSELFDLDGNRYLDFTAGQTGHTVGHNHPQVTAAIQAQAKQLLQTPTTIYHEQWIKLSEELSTRTPFQEDARVYLCNATAEAKEMAMTFATYHTGRQHFLEFVSGTYQSDEQMLSQVAIQRPRSSLHTITPVPFPNPYRPLFASQLSPSKQQSEQGDEHDIGIRIIHYLEHVILRTNNQAKEIAGIFVEPIHQESGNVVPPASFLPALRELCDRQGILLIANEEQSGLGRTGRWWAMEYSGIEADIVCMAKGTANGLPIGGLVIRTSIDNAAPSFHEISNGSNPLICAAALATLKVLTEQGVAGIAQEGFYLQETLNLIAGHHATIGDIRGNGLLVGVEFVWDREHREAAPGLRNRIKQRCLEHGLILTGCGESTVQFAPPLTVTRAELDEALTIFEYALSLAEAELLHA